MGRTAVLEATEIGALTRLRHRGLGRSWTLKRSIEFHDDVIEIGRKGDPEHIGQQQRAGERRIRQHTNAKGYNRAPKKEGFL